MFAFFKRIIDSVRVCWSQFRLYVVRSMAEKNGGQLWLIFILCFLTTAVVATVLSVVLGSICLTSLNKVVEQDYTPDNVFDAAYYLLFTNGGQNLFAGTHWLGLIITTAGVLLIAILTSAMTNAFERRVQRYLEGESTFLLKNHIVIFGVSDYLYSIINEKKGQHQKFLIVTTQNVASVRREVLSFLGEEKDGEKRKRVSGKDLVFFFGDRTSDQDIARLSLERAKEVYIIGDAKESDDIESYRDANNLECAKAISRYLKKKKVIGNDISIENGVETVSFSKTKYGMPLPCHVMFEYQTSFSAFHFCKIENNAGNYIDFLPFNYYDLWARKVIVSDGKGPFSPLNKVSGNNSYISENSTETVHFIILGMTKMGIAMGLQAAQVCHYPNFKSSSTLPLRTKITFIDSNADTELNYFKGRFPSMMQETRSQLVDYIKTGGVDLGYKWKGDPNGWYDIEWEFIKGRIESDSVRDYLSKSVSDEKKIVSIAVCLPKSHQSIASAMYLPDCVYEKALQILVYQRMSGGIINSLAQTKVKPFERAKYRKLIPFGMIDNGYDSSLNSDKRAMLVSYVYDSFYEFNEETKVQWKKCDSSFGRYDSGFVEETNSPGCSYRRYNDYKIKWIGKDVTEKLSCAFNANSIEVKLQGLGYSAENCPVFFPSEQIEVLARVEHNRWNIEKFLTGFRTLTLDELSPIMELWNLYLKLHTTEKRLNKKEVSIVLKLRDAARASFSWTETTQYSGEERESAAKLVKDEWETIRKHYKGWPSRAHLDLCSVEELQKREDETTIDLDKELSKAIPYILKRENI